MIGPNCSIGDALIQLSHAHITGATYDADGHVSLTIEGVQRREHCPATFTTLDGWTKDVTVDMEWEDGAMRCPYIVRAPDSTGMTRTFKWSGMGYKEEAS